MRDQDKTKAQLLAELAELRRRVAACEAIKAGYEQAEATLRESERQYRTLPAVECRQAQELALLDQVRMAVAAELDLTTVLRTIVEAIAKTFGFTQVSIYLLRGEILELQHQVGYGQIFNQIPITQGVCGRVVRTGRPELIIDVNADPDFMKAMEGVVSEICVPLFDQDKVVGLFNIESTNGVRLDEADLRLMVALSQHINLAISRARLYTEARDSAERFRQLAENIHDVFWITSTDGLETIYVSPAYEKIWGRSGQSLIEQPYSWIEAIHPADRERVISNFKAQDVTQPGVVEYRVVRPDDSVCWVRDRFFPIWDEAGRVYRRAGIAEDITERKQAEAALRESEQRYRIVSDLTSDFAYVFRVEPGGEIILEWITDAFSRVTGFDPAELKTPQDWLKLVHPDDTSFIYGRFEQTMLKGQFVVSEFRIVTQKGETCWLRNYIRPIWDPSARRVVNLYGAAQDITKRKKAEQALQQSEYRFRELAEKNAQLYWEAWKRMQEQTALRKTAALISSSLDLPTVLSRIAEQMGQAIDVTSTHILGHNPEMTTGVTLAQYFSPEANPAEQISYQGVVYNLRRDLPSLLAFLQSDEPVCIFHADEPDWPEVERLKVAQLGLHSGLFFRLEIGNEILGSATLWESRRRRVFTIREIVFCQSIAQHAAIAINNAHLLERARQDAETKETLLQEVNHRVKNNLAAIIGLLYAERRHEVGSKSQPILEAIIQDIINRVQSLATVHSLLSASSWTPLSLSELTEHVIDSARQTLPPEKQLFFEVSPALVWVTPQQASNLALIINELTINTIKHALLGRQNIQVMVQIDQKNNRVSFKFQDDGPSYPAEVLSLKQHNMGFYLIQNLVQKALRGEITLSNEPEPTVTIHFPVSGDLAALTENLE